MEFTSGTLDSVNLTYAESTIVINNVMLSDGGMYECIIDSDAIMVSSNRSATVAVIDGMCTCSSFILQCISISYTQFPLLDYLYPMNIANCIA